MFSPKKQYYPIMHEGKWLSVYLQMNFTRLREVTRRGVTPKFKVMFHRSPLDIYDSHARYPNFILYERYLKEIGIEKAVATALPTKENECSDDEFYGEESCKLHHRFKLVEKEKGCKLPFSYDKRSMVKNYNDTSYDKDFCGKGANLTVDDFHYSSYLNGSDAICPKISPCKTVSYSFKILLERKVHVKDRASIEFMLLGPQVLYITDYVAYDAQSFIGEVGGTLGLMLGLSALSFVDFLEYLLNKILNI